MARLGVFCFPGTGHTNPITALARALEERGHRVVIFGIADVEERVRAAGIEFSRIGETDYPPGTLRKLDDRLGELRGLASFRFTVERVKNTALMVLRDGPDAVRRANLDALLVDEADMGGSVAEHVGLPFISIAMFPPLIEDNRVPAFCFPWPAGHDVFSRVRNELGFRLLSAIAKPIFVAVNRQRKAWGLKELRRSTDALSRIAQITQLPRALEFQNAPHPALLHYTGPFVNHAQRPPVEFAWGKLKPLPLVYASLGTLQNGSETLFKTIAAGCAKLNVQLVLSLGGGLDPEEFQNLPGDPVVVRFAPQLDLIKRASVVITHAGLNTVLESLAEGVPMVAIPLGNDQPGVGARLAARGAGVVLSRRRLTAEKVERALRAVLQDDRYRQAAATIQQQLRQIDGPALAVRIIEEKLGIELAATA
jgi:zeaxanthin glucosyltransferase